jgi:hypothetical protein
LSKQAVELVSIASTDGATSVDAPNVVVHYR